VFRWVIFIMRFTVWKQEQVPGQHF